MCQKEYGEKFRERERERESERLVGVAVNEIAVSVVIVHLK